MHLFHIKSPALASLCWKVLPQVAVKDADVFNLSWAAILWRTYVITNDLRLGNTIYHSLFPAFNNWCNFPQYLKWKQQCITAYMIDSTFEKMNSLEFMWLVSKNMSINHSDWFTSVYMGQSFFLILCHQFFSQPGSESNYTIKWKELECSMLEPFVKYMLNSYTFIFQHAWFIIYVLSRLFFHFLLKFTDISI